MEFGKTLREAREAKGLSVSELSAKTHIMSQIIAEMEIENFKRIPAPIYGRGFVKQLCKTLDIAEVQKMIEEFMSIFNNTQDEPKKPAVRKTEHKELTPPRATSLEPKIPQPEPHVPRTTPNREFRKPVPLPKLPPIEINWRLVILGAGVACIILIAALTVRALYKTTNSDNATPSAPAVEEAPAPNQNENAPQSRVPAKVPDLYIE